MAKEPRVVAHLGRPETPEETAARKAENTRRYRQSKSVKNLLIALGSTLAIVAIIYFGVPRGELADPPAIDVENIAHQAETQFQRSVVVPDAPSGWGVNTAEIQAGSPTVWSITYNQIPGADRSFLRFAQALDGNETWVAQTLGGARPTGEQTIDGVTWTEYDLGDAETDRGELTYALSVQAGTDHILLYGRVGADDAATIASALSNDVTVLQKEQSE
ncbi:DUF4245 family protein [Microbacterium amylolyticum]|uniref:DUF4245 domain-containing protein n=1 Tax=Microbacterium amylolyticum TaxID=936337 RepID=A0ABS4ZFY2_9MICO|nr:DUF4245 family protein [Microbacterium amylolyticum]MBP2435948.1 hypothetical protein [Microbacterium amylolyticum]